MYSTLSTAGHMVALPSVLVLCRVLLYDILAALRARKQKEPRHAGELWCVLGVVMLWWSEVSVSRAEANQMWRGVGDGVWCDGDIDTDIALWNISSHQQAAVMQVASCLLNSACVYA